MTEQSSHNRKPALQRMLAIVGRRLRENPHGPGIMPVSNRLATWVGIFSACVGGFLGLDTYRTDVAKKVDQSVAKTFDMIHVFNEPALSDARRRVISYVEARRYCDSRIIASDLTDHDFFAVIDFFDLVNACVASDLCDRATAERFFTPYANYQWPVLARTVEALKSQEHSLRADAPFAEGIKAFALQPVAAPPCEGNF